MSDVTRILSRIEAGDQHAAEALLPLVYDELRKLAAVRMVTHVDQFLRHTVSEDPDDDANVFVDRFPGVARCDQQIAYLGQFARPKGGV